MSKTKDWLIDTEESGLALEYERDGVVVRVRTGILSEGETLEQQIAEVNETIDDIDVKVLPHLNKGDRLELKHRNGTVIHFAKHGDHPFRVTMRPPPPASPLPLPRLIPFLTKLMGPSVADEVLDDLERNYYRDVNERHWSRRMAISCAVTKAIEAVAGYWFNLDRLKKIADIVATIRKPTAK